MRHPGTGKCTAVGRASRREDWEGDSWEVIVSGQVHPSYLAWHRACARVASVAAGGEDVLILATGEALLDPSVVLPLVPKYPLVIGHEDGLSKFAVVWRSLLPPITEDCGVGELVATARATAEEESICNVACDDLKISVGAPVGTRVLGNKAGALVLLSSLVDGWAVPRSYVLTREGWSTNRGAALKSLQDELGVPSAIVRSAFKLEDAWGESAAGAFRSIANVDSRDAGAMSRAIDAVFASAGDRVDEDDRVLVQEFIQPVDEAGVLMTYHPDSGAPYHVVTLDDWSGRSDTVTGGKVGGTRTWYIDRGSAATAFLPPEVDRLASLGSNLEELLGVDGLDCEYAVANGTNYLLQVRPIVRLPRHTSDLHGRRETLIRSALEAFRAHSSAAPGTGGVFSTMSDWNPAEMIGRRPCALARSFYEHLITDATWARQRYEYGYQDLRGTSLLVDFAGTTYVDVAASLRSFIPRDTPEHVVEVLVGRQLELLRENPSYDDKLEFRVAHTCSSIGLLDVLEERYGDQASGSDLRELAERLKHISLAGLKQLNHQWAATESLRHADSSVRDVGDIESACARLIEHGTLPFAHLARTAFVCTAILRDLEGNDYLDQSEVEAILGNVTTISSDFMRHVGEVANGARSFESLVRRYGHVRPGTYDIRVPAYGQDPDRYLRPLVDGWATSGRSGAKAQVAGDVVKRVELGLAASGIGFDGAEFLSNLTLAVSSREAAKDAFTMKVSGMLEAIAAWGRTIGVGRETLAHVRLSTVVSASSLEPLEACRRINAAAEEEMNRYQLGELVELPDLITEERDFWWHRSHQPQPAFVTSRCVSGPVVRGEDASPDAISGRIVLLERADPGCDWILTLEPLGIITAYGGMNSHMTVRCTELGLPAVIGVGRHAFGELARSLRAYIDCGARRVAHE